MNLRPSSPQPKVHPQLGDLVAIDGSLIDAVCSMTWADYSSTTKKAKIHIGFDVNRGIPGKVCLTDGKGDERPLVTQLCRLAKPESWTATTRLPSRLPGRT
jgi:hypothetical protein